MLKKKKLVNKISSKTKQKVRCIIIKSYHVLTSPFRGMPDFIIIGAQKSGTTSLFEWLKQHHQIIMSNRKEVHYFDKNYHKGKLWYRSFFPYKKRVKDSFIIGEATPNYLFYPHAAKRIAKELPKVKIIILLRNPIDRALSHYHHEVNQGRESLPIVQAMLVENDRVEKEYNKMLKDEFFFSEKVQYYSYKTRGLYYKYILEYEKYFPRKNILIIQSEKLFNNPNATLKEIYSFLEITKNYDNLELMPKNVNKMNYDSFNGMVKEYLKLYFNNCNNDLFNHLKKNYGWRDFEKW